jgi:hypothetical protein
MTKMGKFIPTRGDADTGQFTPFFHEWIELNFGAPRGVVSDQDRDYLKVLGRGLYLLSLKQMNWAKLLPAAEFAYNNNIADNVIKGEAPAARD